MTINTQESLAPGTPTGAPQLPAVASQGMATELRRVVQEGRDWLVWVKENPREEIQALTEIKKLCQNKAVAEKGEYAVPIGGSVVKGPTIHLMKSIALKWGCIDYGWVELYSTDTETCGRVYARDLTTKASNSETVTIKHVRYTKSGGYQPIKDPDSIYRHCAIRISKRLRECLKSVIPANIIEEAMAACKATLETGTDLQGTITKMLKAFESDFRIDALQLAKFLKKPISKFDIEDVDSMRTLHRALRDDETTIEEVFGPQEEISDAEVIEAKPETGPDAQNVPQPSDTTTGDEPGKQNPSSAGQDQPIDSTPSDSAEVKASAPATVKRGRRAKADQTTDAESATESKETAEPTPATEAVTQALAAAELPEDVF